MRGLRVDPSSSSARLGWQGVRICNWASRVEAYRLPTVPELIVALHSGGDAVDRHDARAATVGRSWPGLGTVRPPGISDSYRPRGPFSCTTAHLSVSRIQVVAEAVGRATALADVSYRFGIDDPLLNSILTSLAREIESPAQFGTLLAEHLVDALIIHVLRGGRQTRPAPTAGRLSDAVLARVREKIEALLAFPVSVQDLASEAGLSQFHFSRAFRNTTGRSPYQYLTERRIERARTLLLHGCQPLSRIAVECGFASQQHFSTVFRRHVGNSPAAYRHLRDLDTAIAIDSTLET